MKPARLSSFPTAQAAAWLARRDAGWSEADERDFQAWLQASVDHAEAWREVERVMDRLRPGQTGRLGQTVVRELGHRRRRRRARALTAATAIVLLALLLSFAPRRSAPAAASAASSLVVAHPERRVLVDGSVVELNDGARIEVAYSPATRDVRLVAGEAHFAVAKNPQRPFIVPAGAVTVRAVGTQFAIRVRSESTEVLVTEGRVAVQRLAVLGALPTGPVFVNAGGRVLVPAGPAEAVPAPENVSPAEAARLLAWRGPRLVLSGTPLSQAIAALNRQNALQISIADPLLGRTRLSGVFRADNAEGFVRLLETSYGVRVERRGARDVVLRSGPP